MIALHAWRSAASVTRYRSRFSTRPLIVALTGTDVYRFLHSDEATTRRSLEDADVLIALHDLVGEALPAEFLSKVRVVHQSVANPGLPRRPSRRFFDVCVVGHLRHEKDPMRAAYRGAGHARGLPVARSPRWRRPRRELGGAGAPGDGLQPALPVAW